MVVKGTRELVIIPNKMSVGLLYSLHINLKHPTKDQLQKAVETRFYISNIANKCQEVSDACTLCVSSKPIPIEVYDYKPNVVPDHPGMSFSVDIMKECSKMVVVAADNFSGFISTSFIESEKETDLRDGIVKTVTPFMSSSLSRVRVDRAPGFAALKNKAATLEQLTLSSQPDDSVQSHLHSQ